MDETVYQCPECNYNADNISDLDSHIVEFHQNQPTNEDGDVIEDDDDHQHHHNNVIKSNGGHHHHHHQYDDMNHHENIDDNMNDDEPHMLDDDDDYDQDEFFDDGNVQPPQLTSTTSKQQFSPHKQQPHRNKSDQVAFNSMTMAALSVPNTDNHYERQYTCKRCGFSTNNPRAVLYHRKEYHYEKINVHECLYCQYASQYSGKVERHTLLRHKIDISSSNPQAKTDNSEDKSAANKTLPLNLSSLFKSEQQQQQSQDGGDGKYQCNKCPCKYKRSHDLYRHMRQKHGIDSSQINEYVKQLDVVDVVPAADDGATTATTTSFNDETESVAAAAAAPSTPQPQPSKYECPYCVYTIASADKSKHGEYVAHVKDHLCGKMFRCVLCNSVYKYRGDCVVHLKRKHQKADMVAQNYVERFNLDAMLDDLGKVVQILKPKQMDELESEEKLFGCSYCDYKANYKGDVYKHQTRRHPGAVKSVNVLKSNNATASSKNGFHMPTVIVKHATSASSHHSSSSSSLSSSHFQTSPAFKSAPPPLITPVVKQQQHIAPAAQHEDNSNTFDDVDEFYDDQGGGQDEYFIDDENAAEEGDLTNYEEGDGQDDELMMDNTNGGDEEFIDDEEDQTFFDEPTEDELLLQQDEPLQQQQQAQLPAFKCQLCPYVGKSRVKLELHMSTHANLRQYMCPICKRRSNFKWDVQKHMRKIHQNFTNEVICLNVDAVRKEQLAAAAIQQQQQHQSRFAVANAAQQQQQKLGLTKHARRERKFKCSLCNRTSKWQWDIRKHMRTVHKGRDGDVIVLKDKELIRRLTENHRLSLGTNGTLVEKPNLFSSQQQIVGQEQQSPPRLIRPPQPQQQRMSLPPPPSLTPANRPLPNSPAFSGGGGTDSTGNKKFKCSLCPYRSNWKADLYKHIRKHHMIDQPTTNDIVVLESDKAAATIDEYERTYGALIRKRSKVDMDEMKAAAAANLDASASYQDDEEQQQPSSKRFHYDDDDGEERDEEDDDDLIGEMDDVDEDEEMDSDFLLSVKRYQCGECALRTCKRAELLVHAREKHPQKEPLVRVLSVEEAAESIEQYENSRLYQQVKQFARDEDLLDDDEQEQEHTNGVTNGHGHHVNGNGVLETSRPITRSLSSPSKVAAVTTASVTTGAENPCYYRCPFCSFKNSSNILMRRHLVIHYESKKAKKQLKKEQEAAAPVVAAPPPKLNGITPTKQQQQVYRCNLCSFKSPWHHIVRKHVVTSHFSSRQAQVAKQSATPPPPQPPPLLKHNGVNGVNGGGSSQKQPPNLNGGANKRTDSGNSGSSSSSTSLNKSSKVVPDDADYDDLEKVVESIALTGNDGQRFTTTFLVYNPPQLNGQTVPGLSVKKKMYFCQSCPYKTNNYCNLKQHLIQHRFMQGYFKCRFCSYYVSMTRLLKQHEILHPEYLGGSDATMSPTKMKMDFSEAVDENDDVNGHHHKDLDLLSNNNSEIISSY